MTTPAAFADTRLMVATPIYDGAQGRYVRSAIELAQTAQTAGLATSFEFNLYQACITRARNVLLARFLMSDATHLLFADADIEFAAADVLSMVRTMRARPDCDVLGAPYTRRRINWDHVARAAALGLGKDDPAQLARFAGDFVMQLRDPAQSFRLDEPVELTLVGTGLMMIRRDAIERLCARHPELDWRPDPDERHAYVLGDTVPGLFNPVIDPVTRSLLTEDFAFCHRARDAGMRIWLAPWVRTSHSGPAVFDAVLADMAHLFPAAAAATPE